MGFDQFGIKSFVSETRVEKFVTYLEQGKVVTTRCQKCKVITFPPKVDCVACGCTEVEWVEIKETGTLETFTTVMVGPAGFEKETPYTLVVAQFPCGIRILGRLDKKIPAEEIRIGMKLKVEPVKISPDRFSYQLGKV